MKLESFPISPKYTHRPPFLRRSSQSKCSKRSVLGWWIVHLFGRFVSDLVMSEDQVDEVKDEDWQDCLSSGCQFSQKSNNIVGALSIQSRGRFLDLEDVWVLWRQVDIDVNLPSRNKSNWGLAASSTPIVTRFRASTPKPKPGNPIIAKGTKKKKRETKRVK